MAINLEKGGRINLSKENPNLKRVRFGLGWDINGYDTGGDFDLDASVFLCANNGEPPAPKLISDDHFIFYNHKESPDGSVVHSGDNRTGGGDGDDETITVDLTKIDPKIDEISFIVTIHKAEERKQNFGQVSNSYIVMHDDETGEKLGGYPLEDDFSVETAVQFGSLYKKDGQWLFKAVGQGHKRGLADFVLFYGGTLG